MNATQSPERRLLRPAALMAALSALGLTFTLMVGPALATDVEPVLYQGNPTCGELGDFTYEFKVEPPTSGVKDDPNSTFEVELTVYDTADGQAFDFEANQPVQAVFVKGGPGGNLYDYGAGADSDEGLHAPGNDAGTAVSTPPWSGLSHISFCFGEVEESEEASTEESTEASVEESTEASVEESTEASVEGSVLGGTGTPAPSTPDTALGADNGPSPLPTILFASILVASLAGLAWVNVQAVRNRS
jgi:hypothetical protein